VDPRPAPWNAPAYHRVSAPQTAWGREVLDRLQLVGTETVLDAGCGPGKLTRLLAERLPQGRVVALDASPEMLAVAKGELAAFGNRVDFVQAALPHLPLPTKVDAIFSTATLHWVFEQLETFRAFLRVIRPGGQLEFQCGGMDNLHLLHVRATELAFTPEYADAFVGWKESWWYPSAEETAERLRTAGWTRVRTWAEHRPTPFEDAASFSDFIASVNLRPFLAQLDPERARRFTATLLEAAGRDSPPYVLDYHRLNGSAFAPGGKG